MSYCDNSSEDITAQILLNTKLDECDEAFAKIKEWIEEGRVVIPGGLAKGFVVGEDEPGPDDRNKMWLRCTTCGPVWYYYSEDCGKWCPMLGRPGDRVTRHRIEETVEEDIEKYYGCNWELADGTNSLGVNLVADESPISISQYNLDIDGPEYCLATLVVRTISSGAQNTYMNLTGGITYPTLAGFVNQLNTFFTSNSLDLEAEECDSGEFSITSPGETLEVLSGSDCNGRAIIYGG